MRVLITGGTGAIGSALGRELGEAGHEVILLTRSDPRKQKLPAGNRAAQWDGRTADGWGELVNGDSAIVHLAGEPIAEGRWTEDKKRRIRDSRVQSSAAVLAAVRQAAERGAAPRALLQGSAVGYYGDCGDEVVNESHPRGDGFLADVCAEWEEATAAVEELGVRRCVLRTGIVFDREHGALPKMALPFRLFAGGRLGDGRQWVPWIHVADEVGAIRFLLEHEKAGGPFNLTAPEPVTNRELTRLLGEVLHRPGLFAAPEFALKLALGEMAEMVLEGQRAVPARLRELGYSFRFAEAGVALQDLLG